MDDMVSGLIALMASPEEFIGPVNLGNPQECSILSLAEQVLMLTKSNSKLVFKPLPQDDPRQRQPDIGLARKELDWHPLVPIEDGLRDTIEYFRHRLAE